MSDDKLLPSRLYGVPFFLRAAAILLLVTGAFGLIFYLTVLIFQLLGRNFLYEFRYKGFDETGLYFILFLYIALNSGLVISALQLLKLKRVGMYLYGISFVVFALLSYILQDDFGWILPGIGMLLLFVILLHLRKLT